MRKMTNNYAKIEWKHNLPNCKPKSINSADNLLQSMDSSVSIVVGYYNYLHRNLNMTKFRTLTDHFIIYIQLIIIIYRNSKISIILLVYTQSQLYGSLCCSALIIIQSIRYCTLLQTEYNDYILLSRH